MKFGIPAISAAAAALLSRWLATGHVEGKWAEADNAALREQEALTADALRELKTAESENAVANLALFEAQVKIEQVENELRTAINRAPLVETFEIEVPGDCPATTCPLPDTRQHFRLWNAAITNSGEALSITGETAGRNDGVWRSHHFASMDAGCGLINGTGNERLAALEPDQCGGKWLASRLLVRAPRNLGQLD